jgi:CPA2 family monovalent cation:H+ antiporter-2
MDSLFLGGMLASSSTTIIIRAFDEMGVKTKQFARIVFGVLIVEDIVVILLMVLLSTIAVTQQFQGAEIIYTISKLLFFLAIWFLAGIFLLPTFLKKAKSLLDEETLLILSLGLCLGMVVLATQVGFSAELGAFIMGSIIAETTSAEKVDRLIKPVKDLFGSVFFVSVGMMINPAVIVQYGGPVIIVTLLTLFGKLFSTTLGALISGQPLKQSVQVGMSMAQIGEFAFIVATLGLSLGVISDFLFPVAVGASAITTFTTPYMIKWSEPFYRFIERSLPKKWIDRLNRYSISTQTIQAENEWKVVLFSYLKIVVTNAIILVGLIALSIKFLIPFLSEYFDNPLIRGVIALVVSFGLGSPFLLALMSKQPRSFAYKEMWLNKGYSRGPLLIIEVLRIFIGVTLIGFWVFEIFYSRIAIFIAVPFVVLILYVFAKRLRSIYMRIEEGFLGNLNARETAEYKTLSETVKRKEAVIQNKLEPWDAHIVPMVVPQQADYIGRNLKELAWREKYGINIVYIKRGEKLIHAPDRNQILLPFDRAGIIATDEQIQNFKPIFDRSEEIDPANIDLDTIVLDKILVNEFNKLKGNDIRNSGIREKTNGLVIGIERKNNRILNPDSSLVFEWDDVVWIVGERKKIMNFKKITY